MSVATVNRMLGNPLLEDARQWFVDNDGGYISVRVLRLNEQGKVHAAKIFATRNFHDAHLVSSGLEILEALVSEDPKFRKEARSQALSLLGRSNAKDGWAIGELGNGVKTIITADGAVLDSAGIDVSSEEEEFITALPDLIRSLSQ